MQFRFGLLILFVHFFAYGNPVIVSMEPDHIPCPGGNCKETCVYDAEALIEYQGFEVEGQVKIKTLFDNQTNPQKIQMRTLVRVDVDMVGATALWDESSLFERSTLRLDKTFNYVKLNVGPGDKGLKRAEWSETQFQWPESFGSLPQATVRVIGGKTADEIKRKFPKFYNYLRDSAFGNNWMSEFALEKSERRPERDMENFPENILSPTFVSFYHLRFIPFVEELRYNLFVNYSTNPKNALHLLGPFQVQLKGQPGDKANLVVFQGDLAFGDFESQPGKPAKFFVDKSTNQLERIELNMRNEKMGFSAQAWTTAMRCQMD